MQPTSFAPTASQPRPTRPPAAGPPPAVSPPVAVSPPPAVNPPPRPTRQSANLRPADHPTYLCVTTHVTDGLDGVMRVISLLRGRQYRLRDLSINVREGVVASTVSATVLLGAQEHTLLLNRLRRVPSVVSADCL
jgi:hypothetical protein